MESRRKYFVLRHVARLIFSEFDKTEILGKILNFRQKYTENRKNGIFYTHRLKVVHAVIGGLSLEAGMAGCFVFQTLGLLDDRLASSLAFCFVFPVYVRHIHNVIPINNGMLPFRKR